MNGQGELVQDVNSVHLWGGSLEILGFFFCLYMSLKKLQIVLNFKMKKGLLVFLPFLLPLFPLLI